MRRAEGAPDSARYILAPPLTSHVTENASPDVSHFISVIFSVSFSSCVPFCESHFGCSTPCIPFCMSHSVSVPFSLSSTFLFRHLGHQTMPYLTRQWPCGVERCGKGPQGTLEDDEGEEQQQQFAQKAQ